MPYYPPKTYYRPPLDYMAIRASADLSKTRDDTQQKASYAKSRDLNRPLYTFAPFSRFGTVPKAESVTSSLADSSTDSNSDRMEVDPRDRTLLGVIPSSSGQTSSSSQRSTIGSPLQLEVTEVGIQTGCVATGTVLSETDLQSSERSALEFLGALLREETRRREGSRDSVSPYPDVASYQSQSDGKMAMETILKYASMAQGPDTPILPSRLEHFDKDAEYILDAGRSSCPQFYGSVLRDFDS